MKIAITGHRPNKLGNDYDLTSPLVLKIKDRLQKVITIKKPEVIITGVALGIDTLMALLSTYNNIPFWAAIPCRDQDKMWPPKSKELYNYLIYHPLCTRYLITDGPYDFHCMQKRNIWMVDKLVDKEDRLVAVWDESPGGTANCVNYAKAQKKEIIHINPKLL